MITGKNNNDQVKTSGASASGVFSQSGESESKASSEGSDANSQNDSQPKTSSRQDPYDDALQNGTRSRSTQNGVPCPSQPILTQHMPIMPIPATGVPGTVVGPTTNLNIGMDYLGATMPSPVLSIRPKGPATAIGGALVPGGPPDLWMQVYLTLCYALAASAVGAYLHILMNIGGFLTMVACIVCMVLLLNMPVYHQRERFGLLMAVALFELASVGPLIEIVLDLDPRIT